MLSTLQRIELMHFTAFVHVSAIMWHCAFAELRALTNGDCVELNPMELNELYDSLGDMATTLQGPNPLTILDDGWRPWPKVKQGREDCRAMYARLEANLEHSKELLRSHQSARDTDQYTIILKEVLHLFGEAIHESLQRTMSDFLESTNGPKANSKLEDWEKDKYSKVSARHSSPKTTYNISLAHFL